MTLSFNPFRPLGNLEPPLWQEAYPEMASRQKDLRELISHLKENGARSSVMDPFHHLEALTDPDSFDKTLYLTASRLSQRGEMEAAQAAFQILVRKLPDRDEKLIASAQENLTVITGQGGSFAGQMEHQWNKFLPEILNLPMLGGMVVGGFSYRVFRGLSTPMLFPAGVYLSKPVRMAGVAARSVSGLMTEAAAFTGTKKKLQELTGSKVDWGVNALQSEYLGAISMLGGIRSFGFGFGSIAQRINPSSFMGATLANGLPPLGVYLGILGSPYLDYAIKNRPGFPEKPDYLGALLTLAHFKAADLLLHVSRPNGFKNFERAMEERVVEARIPKLPQGKLTDLISKMKHERLRSENISLLREAQIPRITSVNPDPLIEKVIQNYSYPVIEQSGVRLPYGGKLVFARAVEFEGGSILPILREYQYTVEHVTENGQFLLRHTSGKTLELQAAKDSPEMPFFSIGDRVILMPNQG